uniref:Ovule protein n=1 Tax=Haemonchus contortus TaxID=6289 RepID=A0A7I4YKG2_HAECO
MRNMVTSRKPSTFLPRCTKGVTYVSENILLFLRINAVSAKNQNPLQEKNDLVLEFDLYLPNHERTQNITFHAAAIISRKEVPPTYLIYEASIRKALVLSAKRFITFLHLCP